MITLKLQLLELLLVHKVTVQGLPEVMVSVASLFLSAHMTKPMESTVLHSWKQFLHLDLYCPCEQ